MLGGAHSGVSPHYTLSFQPLLQGFLAILNAIRMSVFNTTLKDLSIVLLSTTLETLVSLLAPGRQSQFPSRQSIKRTTLLRCNYERCVLVWAVSGEDTLPSPWQGRFYPMVNNSETCSAVKHCTKAPRLVNEAVPGPGLALDRCPARAVSQAWVNVPAADTAEH